MKFDRLYRNINEQYTYHLNERGRILLFNYNKLLKDLEAMLENLLIGFIDNISENKKILAVQIISTISAQKLGNKEFNVMLRLDSITNGGKSDINPATFGFNEKDPILNYLEKK
jgi:hypothetical protein